MNAGQQKQNLVLTTEEEMENHQQMDDISTSKEKIESGYYHVTQTEMNKRPRQQKLQSMFKIKEIVKTAKEATAEMIKDKDLNLTEIHSSNSYYRRSKCNRMLQIRNSHSKNTPMGKTHTGEYKWYQERFISFGRNKKR